MKLLLYSPNFAGELVGIGRYNAELAEWLSGRGVEVRVVCAPPYYPAWRVQDGYSAWRYRREQVGRTVAVRCPIRARRNPTGPGRLANLLSFALSSLPVLLHQTLAWRPDAILLVEPTLFCAPAALLAARLGRSLAWLHVQDFEVDSAFGLGILSKKGGRAWLERLARRVERWLCDRFDVVSAVSATMLGRLDDKSILRPERLLFPNWADHADPVCGNGAAACPAGPHPGVTVLYAGNFGLKQGLDTVLAAAGRLERDRPDIRFVLCGDGAARQGIEARAAGLGNVWLLPLQPRDRYAGLLGQGHIHLVPLKAGAEAYCCPSKLGTILAAGGAVIATAHTGTELHRTILDAGGLAVEPGDPVGLAEAIRSLADDPDRRASMGRAARRYAMAHLDREQVLAGFLAALTAAVDRRARAAPAPSDEDALPEPASGGLTPPLA